MQFGQARSAGRHHRSADPVGEIALPDIAATPFAARGTAIALVAAILCAAPAHADQAADALSRLNLIGRWANDCADPVQRGITYEITADGSAVYVNPVGASPVLSVASEGALVTIIIHFFKPADEIRINEIRIVDGNTIIPTMNRNERGEYTVRDGMLLRTGKPMPELHRCSAQGNS